MHGRVGQIPSLAVKGLKNNYKIYIPEKQRNTLFKIYFNKDFSSHKMLNKFNTYLQTHIYCKNIYINIY